ncbi:MAG: LysM peptidoglycan-binding domain-containing protein [Firmicutes bacterium]|nr:LysM peptidoglycan-binding domain-containing protein [Bacillota bacterium]
MSIEDAASRASSSDCIHVAQQQAAQPLLMITCPSGCGGPYVVQPGDSLFAIASKFGTTVDGILRCNPQVVNPSSIFAGQVFCVPNAPEPPQPCPVGCGGAYIVQPADTLASIAIQFGTTVDAIRSCNPELGSTVIAGEVICVPQGG